MKIGIYKVLKSILSLILCTVFVFLAVAVPFYYSITTLTKPKHITKIIQNINYNNILKEDPSLETTLKSYGIDPKKAQVFIESEIGGELIEIYTDEATKILLSIPESENLDIPLIKKIAEENLDKYVKIAEETTKKDFAEEKIKNKINTFIDKNESKIIKTIPTVETTRKVVKTVYSSKLINITLSVKFAIFLTAFAIILISIVFILKKKQGLIWMGISCFVSSIILSAILFFSKSKLPIEIAHKISNFNVEIIESATSIGSEKIEIALFSMVSFFFIFIMLYILICAITKTINNLYPLLDESVENPETEEKTLDSKEN